MLVGSVLSFPFSSSFLFRFSFYFHLFLVLSTDTSIAPEIWLMSLAVSSILFLNKVSTSLMLITSIDLEKAEGV